MKHTKNYLFIAIIVLSAYLIQRSLLFLTGEVAFEEIQKQDQAEGGMFGINISFSYLGMHIFWPYVIAFSILAYLRTKKDENFHGLFDKIESSGIFRIFILAMVPILALILHYFAVSSYFTYSVDKILICNEGHQGQSVPNLPEKVAYLAIVVLILISLIVSFYSLIKLIFKRSSN